MASRIPVDDSKMWLYPIKRGGAARTARPTAREGLALMQHTGKHVVRRGA
jgi:hypothetical protein